MTINNLTTNCKNPLLNHIHRRSHNSALLSKLQIGICPNCNESAIYKTDNGGWECRHCQVLFEASYGNSTYNLNKKNSYKDSH